MLVTLRLAELLTALVVLGNAAALGYGMGLLNGGANPWATMVNLVVLLSDVLFGGVLTYFTVSSKETSTVVVLASLGLIISHGYRAIEYFTSVAYPFCASIWQFLLNDLKLLGAVVLIVLVFRVRKEVR